MVKEARENIRMFHILRVIEQKKNYLDAGGRIVNFFTLAQISKKKSVNSTDYYPRMT